MRRVVTVVALAVLVLATGPGGAQPVQKIKLGATRIGWTSHYNTGRSLEKEGMALGDVELVPLQALPALNDALTAKRVDAVATAEPFVSRLEASGAGRVLVNTGDTFPWQIATVMYSDKFARDRARGVAFMKGYVKA